jgi:quercetin dioxygenase-like cupin family protein
MQQETSTTVQVQPLVQTPDQAQVSKTPNTTVRTMATGAQTGDALGAIENTVTPGSGVPMHIHHNEDEVLYILEGKLLFVAGDTRVEAEPGTFIYGPRNIAHGFRALGSVPTRFVEFFLPAGMEELFGAPETLMGYLKEGRLPAKYNLEVVGPIPE